MGGKGGREHGVGSRVGGCDYVCVGVCGGEKGLQGWRRRGGERKEKGRLNWKRGWGM